MNLPRYLVLFLICFSAYAAKAQQSSLSIRASRSYFTETENCVRMDAVSSNPDIVRWQWTFEPGDTTAFTIPGQPYSVCFPDSICYTVTLITTDNLNVQDTAQMEFCPVTDFVLYIPSAFIPNGDGINDMFLPVGEYCAQKSEMAIYSRTGERVFLAEQNGILTKGWNGTQAGMQTVMEGPYLYEIIITDCSGEVHEYRDVVLLLR